MNLKEMYNKVNSLISLIDFTRLWDRFKPIKFALYDDKECYFNGEYVEKTEQFIGNTAIEYNGEIIAIWNLLGDIDDVVLTSKIIHEMFHGFQIANKDTRFPNELEALYDYCYNDENLSIKLEENKIIKELVGEFKLEKLNYLFGLRKYRSKKFNYEFLYESRVEQIEGTANFIELYVLKQLNKELFQKKLKAMVDSITTPNKILPIRVITYDIGALLLYILRENNIEFDESFSNNTFSENLIINVSEVVFNGELSMATIISNYYKDAFELINRAKDKNEIIEEKESNILGLNVYDAIYYNGFIITKYFLMHGDEFNPIILYGDYVVETKEKGKLSKVYKLI